MKYRCVLKCVAAGSAGSPPVRSWQVGDVATIESDDYAEFYRKCRKRRHHFVAIDGEIPHMRPQPPNRGPAAPIESALDEPDEEELDTEPSTEEESPETPPEELEEDQGHEVEVEEEEPAKESHECPVCNREFTTKAGLKRHQTASKHTGKGKKK